MKFQRIDHEKHTTIELLDNKIDFGASKELKQLFIECKKNYIERIILDISRCDFLTSEGIGLIVYMWGFYRYDGAIFLIIKSEAILDLFKECGLYAEMRDCIFPDMESVQQSMNQKHTASAASYVNGSTLICPECGSNEIAPYDRKLRRFIRFIQGKKVRLVCNHCYLVWRK